jgi:ABC-type glycerol-3-phosphate transport system substrate-binding protein
VDILNLSVAQQLGFDDIEDYYGRFLDPVLGAMETRLNIESVPWEKLWQYARSATTTKRRLDVSEIGTTWIGSLADAETLWEIPRSFIDIISTDGVLYPEAWDCMDHLANGPIAFVPLLSDVRLIYYWRDHLDAAKVNLSSAFSSPQALLQTMEKLRAAGQPGWGASTYHSIDNVYHIASWIWSTGKDYFCDESKRTCLCDPEVVDAISDFFLLGRFMPESFDNYLALSRAFQQKRLSVTMDGPWLWADILKNQSPGIDQRNVGIAMPPGPPFIGGSSMVVWKHAPEEILHKALNLIRHLVSPRIQIALHEAKGLLPVNRKVLSRPPFATDSNYRTIFAAFKYGRHLPKGAVWGHLESSLARIFGLVWERLKQNDFKVESGFLDRHLEPLAKRFDRMIELF